MKNDTQNSSGHLKRDDLKLVNTVRNGEKFSGSNRTKALISKDKTYRLFAFLIQYCVSTKNLQKRTNKL